MKEFNYTIKDPIGIHARPAGQLVREASKFKSDITLYVKGKNADAKRLFGVMSLSAKQGDNVKVCIFGNDEELAYSSMKSFFEQNL